jgi:hypothetical protein
VLQMLAAIHHAPVAAADIEELRARMPTIPTRPDVPSGLKQLKEAGFRLVTCANSTPRSRGEPLNIALSASRGGDRSQQRRLAVKIDARRGRTRGVVQVPVGLCRRR